MALQRSIPNPYSAYSRLLAGKYLAAVHEKRDWTALQGPQDVDAYVPEVYSETAVADAIGIVFRTVIRQ